MATPDYIVSLSEQAFFTMISSALEAYEIKHARGRAFDLSENRLETYGNLWGYEASTRRRETVLHVSLADVDTSALRRKDSVTPDVESFRLKQNLVDWLRPELEYLGDFHSHPYDEENDGVKSTRQLEAERLYAFSPADFERVPELGPERKKSYRVGLVATLFKGSNELRRRNQYINEENGSCIRFSYEGFTIWLQCYVFEKRQPVDDGKVALLCPAIGFHAANIA
jgi:hypothetical protein